MGDADLGSKLEFISFWLWFRTGCGKDQFQGGTCQLKLIKAEIIQIS